MEIMIKIALFSLVGLFTFLILKETGSKITFAVMLVVGLAIFMFMMPYIKEVIDFIVSMADKAGVEIIYIEIVLKIIGISYLASFCMEICKDAGAGLIASKVEFSAKILILILAIPILAAVLNSILKIL
ncbi:MAG: stage III sporulation protein AD [Sarcina sp.]